MIDNYFTEYDDSISGESFRDPMGMQVIWSALGQRIFGWHITSRANNLRNFTQALFQHYVVREVERDDSIELPGFAREYYESKDDPCFKRSLVIFLENLFVYTAVQEDFDLSGILGSQSAKHKLQLFDGDPVICIHEDAGILVRQLFLGLNGSYKTPLMQLEILDGDGTRAYGDRLIVDNEASFLPIFSIKDPMKLPGGLLWQGFPGLSAESSPRCIT